MPLTKVLIAVKTYPTLSGKYEELVCTAGFREDGTWIRIYQIPFRKKSYSEQYRKYDWIELDLVKREADFRPESYRPRLIESEIKVGEHIDTKRNWAERKKLVLGKVYHSLSELIAEAKNKDICTSLAVFKPTKITHFKKEKVEDLVAKRISIKDFCVSYHVTRASVYKWLYRYSPHYSSKSKQVVEMESEATKTQFFQTRVAELERIIGQKQLEIDFQNKLFDLATAELGYDVKKNFSSKLSNTIV